MLAHRGDVAAARPEIERLLPLARGIEDLQILAPALVAAALVEVASGDHDAALARLREFDELTDGGPAEYREIQSPEVARIAIAAGDPAVAARIVGDRDVHSRRVQLAVASGLALLEEAAGDLASAEAAFAAAAGGLGGVRGAARGGPRAWPGERDACGPSAVDDEAAPIEEAVAAELAALGIRIRRRPAIDRAPRLRGGGGNRTPVPSRPSGTSPGAAWWIDLASGLPPAEHPSASPGSMSPAGPRAEPAK